MDPRDAATIYGRLADQYVDSNPSATAREEYEWPMVQDLLPDLAGLRVLDAGTGVGHYAERFAAHGAEVVGIDASEGMLEQARNHHGAAAQYCRVDLREALPFEDDCFEVVVSQLTLEHIRDWVPVMGEFARVLDAGGWLVCSTAHPFSTYFVIEHEPPGIGSATAETADYYDVERYDRVWGDDENPISVPFFRRPLDEVVRPLFEAGFVIDELVEPPPETDDELLGYFDDETPRFLGVWAQLHSC